MFIETAKVLGRGAGERFQTTLVLAGAAVALVACNAELGTPDRRSVKQADDAPVNWLMFHGDRQRSGWNPNETILSPSSISAGNFGELWTSDDLDTFMGRPAHLYASPLYVNSVTMTTGDQYDQMQFSVVIAASNNAWVYAINAFDPNGIVPNGTILWRASLGTPGCCYDGPSLPTGIIGTPVIDLNASPPTVYVVADVTEGGRSWRAFALDLGSGNVLPGWPLAINDDTVGSGAVPGILQNGPAKFQGAGTMDQRGGLSLSPDSTVLYVSFGAYGDNAAGFIVAIDTGTVSGTPAILSAFAASPVLSSSAAAGMWASGGTAIDVNGNVYVTTGNGSATPQDPPLPGFWSMSVLGFGPVGPPNYALQLIGTYSPWNHCQMDKYDADLGGGGIISFDIDPSTTSTPSLLAAGGKQGMGYLLDRNNMPGQLDRMPLCHWVSSDPLRKLDPTADPADGSLFGPDTHSYYQSEDGLGQDRPGPLSLFGPYSENCTQGNNAHGRSTPVYFQDANGTNYVFFTGATKASASPCSATPVPPGVVRTRVVTPDPSQPAYLTIDAQDNSLSFKSPGTAVISSNGSDLTTAVLWVLEPNIFRGDSLGGSHPTLYAVDASSMQVLQVVYSSPANLLGPGGKYNAPTVANGVVYTGTDKITAFGLLQ